MNVDHNNPSVLVISSHVVRGSVGNRAMVFALETLGFPVWAVPTIILPWHPGHGPATRLEHNDATFAKLLDDISSAPWIDEVSAVLTGYMAHADQVRHAAELINKLKARNPGLLYLCDPVIGDQAGLYVPDQTASAIKSLLVPLADILTPNRFELEWLVTRSIANSGEPLEDLASQLPARTKLITSAAGENGTIGNVLVNEDGEYRISHDHVESPPNGPGDLTASLFLARLLAGNSPVQALELATSSVYEVVKHSVQQQGDELMLETFSQSLIEPAARLTAVKQ